MPLNREQKAQNLDEVQKLFDSSKVVVLTDYKGIKVEDVTALRRQIRDAKGRFKVVKNTLSRKVFKDDKYAAFRTQAAAMPDATRRHYAVEMAVIEITPDDRILTWDNSRLQLGG